MTDENKNVIDNTNVDDSSSADQTANVDKNDDVQGSEKRYKADMLRYKTDLSNTAAENAKLKEQIEQRNVADLEKSNKHKEVADHYKAENEKLKTKYEMTVETVVNDKRFNAIEREAKEQGMNEKAIKLLKSGAYDTSSVIVETTSENNINVLGVKEFITDLKQKEDWLFVDQKAPNINNGTNLNSIVTGASIKASDLLTLQKKEPAKYNDLIAKSRRGEIKIVR